MSASRTVTFSIPPAPRQPWNSTIQEVRQLFLSLQYKECAAHCAEQLANTTNNSDPVHIASLSFYAGLSLDTLARNTSQHADTILDTFDQAEQHYLKAVATLPSPMASKILPSPTHTQKSASDGAFTFSNRNSIESATSAVSVSTAATEPSTLFDGDEFPSEKTSAIRQLKQFSPKRQSDLSPIEETLVTVPTTPQVKRESRAWLYGAEDAMLSSAMERHLQNYNDHLSSFTSMVQNHITSIKEFRQSTVAAQGRKNLPKSSSSTSLSETTQNRGTVEKGSEDMKERIKKGRERMWERPRFCGEKYQKLCQQALAEL